MIVQSVNIPIPFHMTYGAPAAETGELAVNGHTTRGQGDPRADVRRLDYTLL